MKFKVMMKDPDTLYDAINDAVKDDVDGMWLPRDEAEALIDLRVAKVRELCEQWFDSGEYLTVEIDTEAKTCVVVKSK